MAAVRQNISDMFDGKSRAGSYYDIIMMIVIVASLVPLIFKNETTLLLWLDHITVTIFIIDYILRWFTIDLRLKKGRKSFALYPVTPWAILDLVCILPSFQIIAGAFRMLKIARLFRTLRVLRSLKMLRNNKSIRIIIDVVRDQWRALITVLAIAVGYVLVVALVMFNMEPDIFDNFFSAIYWGTVTLTTIGYGDIYPMTILGQAFTIISAFVGVAVIALPSGIIAGGFMDEIRRQNNEEEAEETADNAKEAQDTGPLEIPVWEKLYLTTDEAAALTNIDQRKIRELMEEPDCDFVLRTDEHEGLINRKRLEDYLSSKEEMGSRSVRE